GRSFVEVLLPLVPVLDDEALRGCLPCGCGHLARGLQRRDVVHAHHPTASGAVAAVSLPAVVSPARVEVLCDCHGDGSTAGQFARGSLGVGAGEPVSRLPGPDEDADPVGLLQHGFGGHDGVSSFRSGACWWAGRSVRRSVRRDVTACWWW